MKDFAGYDITGANAASLTMLEQASHELRCYIGDPLSSVGVALKTSPELVMGHVLQAYLNLLGTEPAGVPVAREAHAAGAALPANDRERRHLRAVHELVEGRWRTAGALLEDLSIDYPRDALALQVGHQIDFFTGNSRMLRDRIARALPHWSPARPGYHALLGMYAFGLEETGDYANAEKQGRASVELEPRDGWGHHAVAHVMEMQKRRSAGIAWMRAQPQAWSVESFLAVHNWWHLALFHLGLGEIDEVLALYDRRIYRERSPIILEMIDASALLWRLHLQGVDVGERWSVLADQWEPLASAGHYAFNDFHAAMALVSANRSAAVQQLLEAQEAALGGRDDNAAFTSEVGSAATRAVVAFGDGNYPEAVRLLRAIRPHAHRFGGSHAQRDVIDLTLIEAARHAGEPRLAHALLNERQSEPAGVPFVPLRGFSRKAQERPRQRALSAA